MHAHVQKGFPELVLLDVGNVLVSLRPWREAFDSVEILLGGEREASLALAAFLKTDTLARFERGLLEVPQFCRALRESFGMELDDDVICERYLRLLGDEVKGMTELIQELKGRGVRVAGLTDTSVIHLPALREYAAVRELDPLLASCEIGLLKPGVETFSFVLDRLQVPAGAVFFSDDKEANVDGARRAGLRAAVFRGADALRAGLGL